jgi:hypothetical protein
MKPHGKGKPLRAGGKSPGARRTPAKEDRTRTINGRPGADRQFQELAKVYREVAERASRILGDFAKKSPHPGAVND